MFTTGLRFHAPRLVEMLARSGVDQVFLDAEHGPLELITGVSIVPQDSIDEIERTDIVFVPNPIVLTPDELHALDRRLIAWVARMHEDGALVCSACGGSLVLAAAGLLSGRETTTHWSHVPVFRQAFPDVRLHEDRILVQTGDGHDIISCGGASSWQDLALLLIARYGSGHSEAIVTRDLAAAERFTSEVDAAAVLVNASTRFVDGEEFGFGAEIGISTQKLHARGPMGLRELTTAKYVVRGQGQTRG